MLNNVFMFHYQLNQNTGCKVKSVVNMNRQPKRLTNRRSQSEQPFYLSRAYPCYPTDDAGLTFSKLPCGVVGSLVTVYLAVCMCVCGQIVVSVCCSVHKVFVLATWTVCDIGRIVCSFS